MISSAKDSMLAEIRKSLHGGDSPGKPGALPYYPSLPSLEAHGAEVEQFCSEWAQVGGFVTRVNTEEEVKEYLATLLPASEAAVVAVSDSVAATAAGLRAWLRSRNIKVVPPLTEFMLPENDGEQSSADVSAGQPPLRSVEQHLDLLLHAHVGITSADYAIADTGTLVLVAGQEHHRLISLLPQVHVCLLNPRRIVRNLAELLSRLQQEWCSHNGVPTAVTLITGPSCTADIEQTLTKGMHGPREVHVLLYSDGEPVQVRA